MYIYSGTIQQELQFHLNFSSVNPLRGSHCSKEQRYLSPPPLISSRSLGRNSASFDSIQCIRRLDHHPRSFPSTILVTQPVLTNKKATSQFFAMTADSSSDSVATAPTAEEFTILNKGGLKLKGILVEGEPESKDLCVLCHGFRSSKLSSTLGNLSKALVEAGVSTCRFDFSGNGDSEGEFLYGNYWREVEDLRSVVEYWTSRGRRVVCVIGHSKGGNCVVLYASKYHDVPNVINLSGRFDLKKGVKDRLGGEEGLRKLEEDGVLDIKDASGNVQYQVTKESLEDRLSTDMHTACLAIPERSRVLTIHGTRDEVIPPEDAYDFAQRIPNHRLLLLSGADHKYQLHQSDLAKIVVEFVKEDPEL